MYIYITAKLEYTIYIFLIMLTHIFKQKKIYLKMNDDSII